MTDGGASQEKVPYEPTLKRRFELSQDSFTQERVKALLVAYKDLKNEIPFFSGMTAFGSLTKGKRLDSQSARTTDIDLFLFVDSDAYKSSIDEFRKRKDFDKIYQHIVRNEPAGCGPTDFVEPLNVEKAVNAYLEQRVAGILAGKIPEDRRPANLVEFGGGAFQFVSLDSDKDYSIFQWVFDPPFGPPSSDLEDTVFIGAPLLFDIGGGMRPYRESFMQKMMSIPLEEQNRLWKTTVSAMKAWERKGKVPQALRKWYPDSFTEAVAIYKPKLDGVPNMPEVII